MNSSPYLKHCPFCGNMARILKTSLDGRYAVFCDCSSHIFYGCEYDKVKTATAWNSRIGE